jgi:hypothetical protein
MEEEKGRIRRCAVGGVTLFKRRRREGRKRERKEKKKAPVKGPSV